MRRLAATLGLWAGVAVPAFAQPPAAVAPARVASPEVAPAATSPVAAAAPRPVDPTRQPQVSVVLFGGLVGPNLARVLNETAAAGVELPRRSETIGPRGSVCMVLSRLGYPAPCHLYYPTIRRLNGRAVDTEILRAEQTIAVPDIGLRIDRRRRVFAGYEIERLDNAGANWRDLNPSFSTTGRADRVVEYDAYTVTFPVADDAAAVALASRLRSLQLDNTSVAERLRAPPKAKLFGGASDTDAARAEAFRTECQAGRLNGERDYADWSSLDRKARKLAEAVPQNPTTVVLIDTPLNAGPNLLQPDLGPTDTPPRWSCAFRTPRVADHGTYLAGIIASRRNGYGFQGVAPRATIQSVPWAVVVDEDLAPAEDASQRVIETLDADTNASLPLKTYLVALDFGIWDGKPYNAALREQSPLIRAIINARRVLVVAAGQSGIEGVPGVDISKASPITPQNLGNEDFVISVTACRDCVGEGVQLLPEANYSSGQHRFVHVAAPGGRSLPGWLAPDGVGLDAGTSPASAYVAGVVARMAAAYPGEYAEARQLKERIQTTSRPLPLYTVGLQPNGDVDKLAAGVVDPYVALLNPRKTWIRTGGEWSEVKVRAIHAPLFDELQNPAGGGVKWLRRLTLTKDPVNGSVWTAVESAKRDPGALMGDVNTLRKLRLGPGAALTFCTGAPVPIANYDDILLPAGGLKGDECA